MPDELRALTPRGTADAARMARWLRERLPPECRIVVSPAVRARQTAEALGLPFETKSELAPGASVVDVLRASGWPDAIATTLVVGHEPTLGHVAAHLLDDQVVLEVGEPQFTVLAHAAGTAAAEANSFRPSAEPVSASTACSGCGIRPTTLPALFDTPAMSRTEPLKL